MRARGFTLVEVMVALAIVAITLPALLMAFYQQVDDAAYLRDKTLAQMLAVNKLAEMRLVIASTRKLQAGKDSGDETFVDRDWYWWVETTATEVANVYRVEIRVALDEKRREQPLYTLSAFVFGDLAIDPEGMPDGDGSSSSGSSGSSSSSGSSGSSSSSSSGSSGSGSSGSGSSGGEGGGSNGDSSGGIPSGLGEGGSSDGQ